MKEKKKNKKFPRVKCKSCGKKFDSRGLGRHLAYCLTQPITTKSEAIGKAYISQKLRRVRWILGRVLKELKEVDGR